MKELKDQYAIYLAYAMGWGPSFQSNAGNLLAAKLGKGDVHRVPMSRLILRAKIKELNRDTDHPLIETS